MEKAFLVELFCLRERLVPLRFENAAIARFAARHLRFRTLPARRNPPSSRQIAFER